MLGKFPRQEEPDSGLDLARGDGGPLVVVGETRGLSGESFEDVVNEGVHDGHGLGGNASVGVNLLEHLVDVDCRWRRTPSSLMTSFSCRLWL